MVIRIQQEQNYKENMLLLLRQEHFIRYNFRKNVFILSVVSDGLTYSHELDGAKLGSIRVEKYLNGLLLEIAEEVIKNKEKIEQNEKNNCK